MKNRYGIEVGQIYIAADGGKYGHLVLEVPPNRNAIVVVAFNCDGLINDSRGLLINGCKLSTIRYYHSESEKWIPQDVIKESRKLKGQL